MEVCPCGLQSKEVPELRTFCIVATLLLAIAVVAAAPAAADLSFGSAARQAGMGGAGLAIVENASKTAFLNPAALAYTGSYFRFPSLDWRYRGAPLGDIIDKAIQGGDISGSDATQWAQDFASQETQFALTADLGFKIGPVEIGARGYGRALLTPDAVLQEWGQLGAIGDPPADAFADVRAAAVYSLPSIGFAQKLETIDKNTGQSRGTIAVGARMHWLHSMDAGGTVTFDGVGGATDDLPASPIENSDWSLDAGVMFSPVQVPNLTVAAVATNLRAATLGDLKQETVLDVGAAYSMKPFIFAADWRNLTGAYDEGTQLNAGAEFKLFSALALRAGFSSRGAGISYGATLLGIDLALTGERTFDAATTLHF